MCAQMLVWTLIELCIIVYSQQNCIARRANKFWSYILHEIYSPIYPLSSWIHLLIRPGLLDNNLRRRSLEELSRLKLADFPGLVHWLAAPLN